MKIMGFGGSGHDWSCCLLDNTSVVVAVDEERLTRSKYGIGSNLLQSQARLACLEAAQITPQDIDYAVACDLVPLTLAAPFRRQLVRIQHHLAHAFGAFFASPFERAAVLIADNSGSLVDRTDGFAGVERCVETLTYWHAHDWQIHPLSGIAGKHVLEATRASDYLSQVAVTDNSLGSLYWMLSEELGFMHWAENGSAISEDGKTMGLAAYGDDRYVDELGQYLTLCDDGQLHLSLTDGVFREHLRTLFRRGPDTSQGRLSRRAAVARAVQSMLERALIHSAKHLRKVTNERYLVMSGGVALNCVANTKIAQEAGFDDIFVMPAAGDNGNALGAALYGLVALAGYRGPMDVYNQLPFLGPIHHEDAFEQAAAYAVAHGAQVVECADPFTYIATHLADEKIIGWYEGRSEFGPRALGHRSIISDARPQNMKDRINKIIKQREPFRPFAPIVLEARVETYFNFPLVASAPFMLFVGDVRPEWQERLPAITHVDGTARVQTIGATRYPSMHKLLQAYEQHTGLAVLLNTSFNRAGEPIVESPMDAMRCFLETELDFLVMDQRIFAKCNGS